MKNLGLACLLIILIAKIASLFALGLTDDEAYYWMWSRVLQPNYLEHPPLIAWLIRASTDLAGNNEFAVRLVAVVFSLGTARLLWRWAKPHLEKQELQWLMVLFFLIPVFSLGSTLSVPDLPMMFFWMLSIFWLTELERSPKAPLAKYGAVGIAVGLALLSKLTAVFLVLGLFIYFHFLRHKIERPKAKLIVICVAALIMFEPILSWNIQENFPSFRFHLVDRQSGHFGVLGFIQFLGSQILYLSPLVFLLAIGLLGLKLRKKQWLFQNQFLAFGLPLLLVFTVQSFFSPFKAHWTAPAILLLLPAMAQWIHAKLKTRRTGMTYAGIGFLFVFNLLYFGISYFPLLPKLHALTSATPWQPRFDVTNDLYGKKEFLAHFDELTKSETEVPLVMSHRYQVAAPVWFYLNRPVISFGPSSNQFEWNQKEADIEKLYGKSAYFVSDNRYFKEPGSVIQFETCEKLPTLEVKRGEVLAREFFFWKCTGFKGPVNRPKSWI